jgi:hypothetical protein
MKIAFRALTCKTVLLRGSRLFGVPAACIAFGMAAALHGQSAPAASSAEAPAAAPVGSSANLSPAVAEGTEPPLNGRPIAIIPIDKTLPGAALEVAGPIQAWNGRAFLTSSGTVTSGDATAQVTLPYRGTLRVCASSTVNLAADSSAPVGQVPGLLIALDHGAVEMSFAASEAREKNADTLLTPYFRILIGGPNAADLKVRLGDHGDTCVDNEGTNAPYVVVTSVFDGGVYRVMPGQRVMFENGSLHEVVDQEKEPCGCPPPTKSEGNEFPLAASEGLAPDSKPPAVAIKHPAGNDQASTTLVYSGSQQAQPTVEIPRPDAGPTVTPVAGSPAKAPSGKKKPGLFRKIGHFFKRVFGAES